MSIYFPNTPPPPLPPIVLPPLIVVVVGKKFTAFYGTRRFVIAFRRDHYLSAHRERSVYSGGSQSVLRGSQGIRDQLPGYPWIHFSNGLFVFGATAPHWVGASFTRFLEHTQRRTTFGRTPLDEWSARLRDLYLTTHNTHNRQTYLPPVGFETAISAGDRPQTYALDRAAAGISSLMAASMFTCCF